MHIHSSLRFFILTCRWEKYTALWQSKTIKCVWIYHCFSKKALLDLVVCSSCPRLQLNCPFCMMLAPNPTLLSWSPPCWFHTHMQYTSASSWLIMLNYSPISLSSANQLSLVRPLSLVWPLKFYLSFVCVASVLSSWPLPIYSIYLLYG